MLKNTQFVVTNKNPFNALRMLDFTNNKDEKVKSSESIILALKKEIAKLKQANSVLRKRAPREGICILLDENNSGCSLLEHHVKMISRTTKLTKKKILNKSFVFAVTDRSNNGKRGGAMPRGRLLRKTRKIGVPDINVISCQKHRFKKPEVQTDDAVLGAYIVAKGAISNQVHIITNDGDSSMETGGPQPIILKVEEAAKKNKFCNFIFIQWKGQKFSKGISELSTKYKNISCKHWDK